MKKGIIILTVLALIVSAVSIPVFAEDAASTPDSVSSAATAPNSAAPGTGRQARGNRGNGPRGQKGQQTPAVPGNGQTDPNSQQVPAQPGNGQTDQQTPNGNVKGMKGRNGQQTKAGKNAGGRQHGMRPDLDQLLKDGVITQEVYDTIANYLKERAQQAQPGTAAPAEGSEPPAQPDAAPADQGGEPPAGGAQEQLLKELLESGAITQEQYDLLTGAAAAESSI